MRTRSWTIGSTVLGLLCVVSLSTGYAAHRDQPVALEAIAAFAPFAPQDLRIGAGLDFAPARRTFMRADVVQHDFGLTLNRRFRLGDVLELSGGAGVYYDFAARRFVPVFTVGRLTF